MKQITAKNPHVLGLRVVDRDDLFPCGFSISELSNVHASLMETRHDFDMLMESASFSDVDDYYNPGTELVSKDFIFEAIIIDRFSRTEKRMSAVVRVLNKHLESEITALPPVVGDPKKSGSFAYVTVQLPFSDGQTVSVIFHSPEGDKKKITANDTLIAFQWLLNKRDITHLVAPEEGTEVSLETLSKRIAQLVEKNSMHFIKTQKDVAGEEKELKDLITQSEELEIKNFEMSKQIDKIKGSKEIVEAKLANSLAALEKK